MMLRKNEQITLDDLSVYTPLYDILISKDDI